MSDPAHHGRSIEDFVATVLFKLDPYYTAWPPFEIRRVGWGYFPVTAVITWQAEVGLPPTEIEHELCFDDGGNSFTHATELPVALARFSRDTRENAARRTESRGRRPESLTNASAPSRRAVT